MKYCPKPLLDSYQPSPDYHIMKHLPDFIKPKMPLILRHTLPYLCTSKKKTILTYAMLLTLNHTDFRHEKEICNWKWWNTVTFLHFFQYDFILTLNKTLRPDLSRTNCSPPRHLMWHRQYQASFRGCTHCLPRRSTDGLDPILWPKPEGILKFLTSAI